MTMSPKKKTDLLVYELWFYRKKDYDDDNERLLGIFSTKALAKAARDRLIMAPGFREYADGFHIGEADLNKTSWKTGFIGWDEA